MEVEEVMLIWVCCYSVAAGHLVVAEREEGQNEEHLLMEKQSMDEELEAVAIV